MFDAPRLTVALTFDHDAISDSVRRGDPPVKLSHAEFGPRVGLPRILALLARDGIPATFFVPGHSLVTFPENTDAILDGGHELACHGWYHEDVTELTPGEEAEILGRSIEAVADRTGAPPAGYRAPYWALEPGDARARRGGRVPLRQLAHGRRLQALPRPPRRPALDRPKARSGASRATSSRCPSTGRSTTGRCSSRAAGATAFDRPREVLEIWLARAALRLRPRRRRRPDDHDASRVHRTRPPDGDARDVHRAGEGAPRRRVRAARRGRRPLVGGRIARRERARGSNAR